MQGVLDATEEITFAAVGLALTRWEGVEISLADLYSIFRGRPFDRRTIVAFGHRHSTTSRRIAGLRKGAVEFFFHFPDQAREHAFDNLLGEVERLSLDRHRCAHGIVDRITFALSDGGGISGFGLAAPWYGRSRLRFSDSDAWGAQMIDSVSAQFVTLDRRIMAFSGALLRG